MRFPKFTELDQDQRSIYSGAPPAESILVMGPPGTGKTVMAFHRAELLNNLVKSKGKVSAKPRVIMYNKVLATYTAEREGVAEGVTSTTMHKWVWHWYKGLTRTQPPTLPDDEYRHDWIGMLPTLLGKIESNPVRLNWGHLIIDEGQDFPKEMYEVLSTVSTMYKAPEGQSRPVLTVFADDNQRITGTDNSTLAQIQDALALKKDRVFQLKKNYRNSKQIAQFSRHYYVGLASGIPDEPRRVGKSLPRVVLASSLEVVRSRITRFASNHPDLDVGVLCPNDKTRKKIFNSLSSRLAELKTVVQTYSYRERDEHPPEDLVFDKGGSVTVLNFQSAKGLEFDAVFIIDPFQGTAGASEEHSKMQLYVMTSRARDHLELLLMDPPRDLDSRLPSKALYEKSEA